MVTVLLDGATFQVKRVLQESPESKVCLAQDANSGNLVVIKAVERNDQAKALRAITERNILREMDSPFIVKLLFTSLSESTLYLVLEHMPGEDLRGFLNTHGGRLTEELARGIMMQLVMGLQYLHHKGIAHRDIKPENLLLTGHRDFPLLKIADFGLSKTGLAQVEAQEESCWLFGRDPNLAFTNVGSHQYVAPEILLQVGYGVNVDWWSAGVVLFEMLAGRTPFAAPDEEQLQLNILDCEIEWSSHIPEECRALITQLLHEDPLQRAVGLREHSWFRGVDWSVPIPISAPSPALDDIQRVKSLTSAQLIKLAMLDPPDLSGAKICVYKLFRGIFLRNSPRLTLIN